MDCINAFSRLVRSHRNGSLDGIVNLDDIVYVRRYGLAKVVGKSFMGVNHRTYLIALDGYKHLFEVYREALIKLPFQRFWRWLYERRV